MTAVTLTVDDLTPFAPDIDEHKAELMIEDALATAAVVAPCILDDDFEHSGAAKAILRKAVLRWNDAGTGVITQLSAGSFQQTTDNRTEHKSLLWPSELTKLEQLCGLSRRGRAFTIDTTPPNSGPGVHSAECSLRFGGIACTCGASINGIGGPLW